MKRLILYAIVLTLTTVLSACAFASVEELIVSANEAFDAGDYQEFNKQYNALVKKDKEAAETYLETVKNKEFFDLENKNELDSVRIKKLASVSEHVSALKEFADSKRSELEYRYEISGILKTISSQQLKEFEDPLSDVTKIFILLDSLEDVKEVVTAFDELHSNANKILIQLENLKVPSEKENVHSNFIKAFEDYMHVMEEKKSFLESNDIEIVAYNQLFMKGNIFSVQKTVDLGSEFDRLTSNFEREAENLKQRIDSL